MTDGRLTGTGPGAVLELRDVSRSFGAAPALRPVSLAVGAGTVTVVTGRNGSGKSTLLRLSAGLLRPSSGSRTLRGTALYLLSGQGARLAQPALRAVATAVTLAGGRRHDAETAARQALTVVGLGDRCDQPAGTMSSGQRARVTLAAALACPVDLLCLDEPTAHLDADGAGLVGEVLERLRDRGAAVLVATHDPMAQTWAADALVHMDAGQAVALPAPTPAAAEQLA